MSKGVEERLRALERVVLHAGEDMLPLEKIFADVVNGHCLENESNTPDFILGQAMADFFVAVQTAIRSRDRWYGVELSPGAHVCGARDWEGAFSDVVLRPGALFKIGKRLWRLTELPRPYQGEDGWGFEYTEASDGSCDQRRTFTRSELRWLYEHGAFVGQRADGEGAAL